MISDVQNLWSQFSQNKKFCLCLKAMHYLNFLPLSFLFIDDRFYVNKKPELHHILLLSINL